MPLLIEQRPFNAALLSCRSRIQEREQAGHGIEFFPGPPLKVYQMHRGAIRAGSGECIDCASEEVDQLQMFIHDPVQTKIISSHDWMDANVG
jgi:hypothetical protein